MSAMDQQPTAFWYPTPETIEKAQVTRLAAGLGLDGFDQLRAFSVEHPDRYWRYMMSALPIRWSKPYQDYVDLSEGAPFPKWFVGGELNWIDTIFESGYPPDRMAVIAETESGN